MKSPVVLLTAMLLGGSAAAQPPLLTVYTYDSFVSEWGPGPAVEAAFEQICHCDLKFVGVGDGAALLARLKLEGARSDADVALGLDTNLIAAAQQSGLFAPHGQQPQVDIPLPNGGLTTGWADPLFLPYDWGHFAFVYDKERLPIPPRSFDELAASNIRIIIQDPRSSTPGLGLLLWVKDQYADKAPDLWRALADNIVTVTAGWSEAYGLFLEGEADMVLSYTTSPAYHRIAEGDASKEAAIFDSHYMQIEVAGKLAASQQPELAEAFLAFMVSEAFQSLIPTTNWMYPAVMPAAGLPKGFDAPLGPARSRLIAPDKVPVLRDEALQEWLAALSR
ncbi:MAG: thiamine ABC transporter substrate binding subunit [Rhodobacteraceae bacterium]|nr:thiamine ABC transporter substrate binding subunit [Paracoccaceae bacterium]